MCESTAREATCAPLGLSLLLFSRRLVGMTPGHSTDTPIGELYNPSRRAFFLGPGAWNADVAIYKNFRIRGDVRTRLSADFFNVFNHPNDVAPNSITGLQDLSRQSNNPRIIQLSLRVDW